MVVSRLFIFLVILSVFVFVLYLFVVALHLFVVSLHLVVVIWMIFQQEIVTLTSYHCSGPGTLSLFHPCFWCIFLHYFFINSLNYFYSTNPQFFRLFCPLPLLLQSRPCRRCVGRPSRSILSTGWPLTGSSCQKHWSTTASMNEGCRPAMDRNILPELSPSFSQGKELCVSCKELS